MINHRNSGLTQAETKGNMRINRVNQLVDVFHNKTIQYPEFIKGINALTKTLEYSGIVGAGMMIEGEPGVGKSRLTEYFIKKYYQNHVREDAETIHLPIISIGIPGRPTIPRVIEKILDKANHVKPYSGNRARHENRLRTMIEEQNVRMLVLDEYHHLVRAEKYTRDTFNFLKVLADDHKLAIVLSGLTSGRQALNAHEELRERLSLYRILLKPFTLKNSYETFLDYLAAINAILDEMGVKCIELDTDNFAPRLLLATMGKQRAIGRSIEGLLLEYDGKNSITQKDFEKAFSAHPFNHTLGAFNPFNKNTKLTTVEKKIAEYEK